MTLQLRKLSYPLGVEICDLDVAGPISESQFGEIYQAFLGHCILLFRNRNITREQHLQFDAAPVRYLARLIRHRTGRVRQFVQRPFGARIPGVNSV